MKRIYKYETAFGFDFVLEDYNEDDRTYRFYTGDSRKTKLDLSDVDVEIRVSMGELSALIDTFQKMAEDGCVNVSFEGEA